MAYFKKVTKSTRLSKKTLAKVDAVMKEHPTWSREYATQLVVDAERFERLEAMFS